MTTAQKTVLGLASIVLFFVFSFAVFRPRQLLLQIKNYLRGQNQTSQTDTGGTTGTAKPTVLPAQSQSSTGNIFGVMIPSGQVSLDTRLSLAKQLGVIYYRGADVKTDRWTGSCSECDKAIAVGLKLILTIRNGGGGGQPSSFPSDLTKYKQTVTDIAQKYKPEVLVVENEENSGPLFYSGTPTQYHQQLQAACSVAHAQRIKCTNGGLVSSLVALLTANDFYERGQMDTAEDYFRRTLGTRESDFGVSSFAQAIKSKKGTDQIAKGKAFIAGYKASGADFINFHWYLADTKALEEAVAYITRATGLPAMTNEIGQQRNEDPKQVTSIMQSVVNLKLPYAVWFSMDVQGFAGARSLFNPDSSIRPNGTAFMNFIKTTYK